MRDFRGRALEAGDPVTVRFTTDRPFYYSDSHGTVLSLGRTRVKVRIDVASFDHYDGRVETFLPGDLEYGHRGTPRNVDRMADAMTQMRRAPVREAVSLAVGEEIITEEQARRIVELWHEYTERPQHGQTGPHTA